MGAHRCCCCCPAPCPRAHTPAHTPTPCRSSSGTPGADSKWACLASLTVRVCGNLGAGRPVPSACLPAHIRTPRPRPSHATLHRWQVPASLRTSATRAHAPGTHCAPGPQTAQLRIHVHPHRRGLAPLGWCMRACAYVPPPPHTGLAGHGGPYAADFVRANLFGNLLQNVKFPSDIYGAIRKSWGAQAGLSAA